MQRTQTVCFLILTTLAVAYSLFVLRSVLLPFVIALFVVIGVRPMLEYLEHRLRLPRAVAIGATFLSGFVVLAVFVLLTWVSLSDLSRNVGAYEQRFERIADWVVVAFPGKETELEETELEETEAEETQPPERTIALLDVSSDVDADANSDSTTGDENENGGLEGEEIINTSPILEISTRNSSRALAQALDYLSDLIRSQVLNLATSLTNIFSYVVLVLIFVFFLLMGSTSTNSRSAGHVESLNEVKPRLMDEIENQVRTFLVMKTLISIVTGGVFGLILWMFGVPLALLFGFLAFLFNFIPNLGPLISSILPLPFLVLDANLSPWAGATCFLLCVSIQFASGNIVEPRMMGNRFDVNPAFLLLALMFFGLIWGIIGMFLATPLVSIMKIVFSKTEMGKPIAELMAGRLAGGAGSGGGGGD